MTRDRMVYTEESPSQGEKKPQIESQFWHQLPVQTILTKAQFPHFWSLLW